ncbi:PKD domain-containing protein [Candidatus Venteria ishoeyi]|uniref:Protease 1 n=1 Tax=Candidatus Venteria ishoeyi TaxID=1899563 RepID=A0A1H6FGJ9_9GAMM|nr:PKD domain-containing protein [Candidatus Venteria ishoeyi]SEH08479.1 Protease 1 precursor [Candidatus Venteria ishoeyi]
MRRLPQKLMLAMSLIGLYFTPAAHALTDLDTGAGAYTLDATTDITQAVNGPWCSEVELGQAIDQGFYRYLRYDFFGKETGYNAGFATNLASKLTTSFAEIELIGGGMQGDSYAVFSLRPTQNLPASQSIQFCFDSIHITSLNHVTLGYRLYDTETAAIAAPDNSPLKDVSTRLIAFNPPLAPSGFTGSALSQTQIKLDWVYPDNANITFKLKRDGTPLFTSNANVHYFEDSELACGSTYLYELSASTAYTDSTLLSLQASTQACSSLTVTSSGDGSGTVSNGGDYIAGDTVELSATAAAGSRFISWQPAPCAASFIMPTEDLLCSARFDVLQTGTLQFAASTYSILENAQEVNIIVSREGGNDYAAAVDYRIEAGSAIAGKDYLDTSGTLNWTDGEEAYQTITVHILDNSELDTDKTLTLRLDNVTGAALAEPSVVVLTIQDNEIANIPPVASFIMDLDTGTAPLTVQLDASTATDSDGEIISYVWGSSDGQQSNGSQSSFTFDTPGDYTVTLTVTDNQDASHDHSQTLTLTAPKTFSAGQAILIAAGGAQQDNTLFPYSNDFTQRMYRLLKMRGYTDEGIIYLNPHAPDIEPLDGYLEMDKQDFDLFEPEQAINQAFAQAASRLQAGQQFILYVHGHARAGNLDIRPPYELSAQSLRGLLDSLPAEVQQVVILDTCFSGSFMQTLAAPGRTILSSADAVSYAWNSEYISFSDLLIRGLRRGQSLFQVFQSVRQKLLGLSDKYQPQTPWLDDNGDGVFSSQDGLNSANVCLGTCGVVGNQIPEILQHQSAQEIDNGSALLWASLNLDPTLVRQVRAVLRSPEVTALDYQGRNTPFGRFEVELLYNAKANRYEAVYDRFCAPGLWDILYQAQGVDGAWSALVNGQVRQIQLPGSAACQVNVSMKMLLNQFDYQAGDDFHLDMQVEGQKIITPYIGIVFPDGNFITYSYNLGFGFLNTLIPYRETLNLNGTRSYPILSFPMPPSLPGGTYQVCGLLMKAQTREPLNPENWLSFSCSGFNI